MVIGRLNFLARAGGTEEENDGMKDRLWMSTLGVAGDRSDDDDFRFMMFFLPPQEITLGHLNLLMILRPVIGSNDEDDLGLVSILVF